MSSRHEQLIRERLRDARILRGSLHCVRDIALVESITAAIVRVCEGGTLEALDLAMLPAAERVPPQTLGALKKAAAGVLDRTGARRGGDAANQPSRRAQSSRRAPVRSDTPALFAEPPPAAPAAMLCPEGTRVYLDTETTGLEAGAHQVIELAAVTDDGAEFVERIRLERGAKVSHQAMAVNGISLTGREWRDARPLADALDAFVRWLPSDAVLVAHNAAFDRRMLEADAARVGVPWVNAPWFCTKLWADNLRALGLCDARGAKLADLCAWCGASNDGAHRALADVLRLREVFAALRECATVVEVAA